MHHRNHLKNRNSVKHNKTPYEGSTSCTFVIFHSSFRRCTNVKYVEKLLRTKEIYLAISKLTSSLNQPIPALSVTKNLIDQMQGNVMKPDTHIPFPVQNATNILIDKTVITDIDYCIPNRTPSQYSPTGKDHPRHLNHLQNVPG